MTRENTSGNNETNSPISMNLGDTFVAGAKIAAKNPDLRCWEFVLKLQQNTNCERELAEKIYTYLEEGGVIQISSDHGYSVYDRYLSSISRRSVDIREFRRLQHIKRRMDRERGIFFVHNPYDQEEMERCMRVYGYGRDNFIRSLVEDYSRTLQG